MFAYYVFSLVYLCRSLLEQQIELVLMFLKKVLDRDDCDPVLKVYKEMLKYPDEKNWASNVFGLRYKYNLLRNDEKISPILQSLHGRLW